MALDCTRTIGLFQRKKYIAMWGVFTSQDYEIYWFLTYYNRSTIPLYIVFFLILHCFRVIVIYLLDNLRIIIQWEFFVMCWNRSDDFLLNVNVFDLGYHYCRKCVSTRCVSSFVVSFQSYIFYLVHYGWKERWKADTSVTR